MTEPEPYSLAAKRMQGKRRIGVFYRVKPRTQIGIGLTQIVIGVLAGTGAIFSEALDGVGRTVLVIVTLMSFGFACAAVYAGRKRLRWRRERGIPPGADLR